MPLPPIVSRWFSEKLADLIEQARQRGDGDHAIAGELTNVAEALMDGLN